MENKYTTWEQMNVCPFVLIFGVELFGFKVLQLLQRLERKMNIMEKEVLLLIFLCIRFEIYNVPY